jgi:hypothetical protein
MAGFDPDEYLKSSAKPAETGKPPKDDGFDPDAYLKDGGREKSAGERFKEPLKTMSFEDWQKNSIIAPAINYVVGASPFGT